MAAATLSILTDKSAQTKTIKLLIAGEYFDLQRLNDPLQSAAYMHALAQARTKFGHALCKCRRTPLKLQIRLREGKFHLAVWPEQGQMHDSNCIFFREDDELSPSAEIRSPASQGEGAAASTGLSITITRPSLPGAAPGAPSPRLSVDQHLLGEKASLRGLMNVLWAESNLTRWHPKWTRDWGRTRFELLRAAESLTVAGVPLVERMFVPRPFREAQKIELNMEWERFVADISKGGPQGQPKTGLLIAPVRRMASLRQGGHSLSLRHLNSPIGINDNTLDFLEKNARTAMRRVKTLTEEGGRPLQIRPDNWIDIKQPEVVAMLHVESNSRGGLWARGCWLMAVHPSVFIPAANSDEVLLIDTLMAREYEFNRILSSESAMNRTQPDWLVRHVLDPQGKPIKKAALEILSNGAAPDFLLRRAALAEQLVTKGIPNWAWTPSGKQTERTVPPLPPHDDLQTDRVAETLEAMQNLGNLHYAYGSGLLSQPNQ